MRPVNLATPEQIAAFHNGRAKGVYERGVMNKGETAYARHLDLQRMAGHISHWAFEPEKLRLASRTFLTPDFRIVLPSGAIEWHEVKPARGGKAKGFYAREDAWIKLKFAAQRYPQWAFFVVWPDRDVEWPDREWGIGWRKQRVACE